MLLVVTRLESVKYLTTTTLIEDTGIHEAFVSYIS